METLSANYNAPRIRRAKMQGKDYLVAPMSLIVPGVLNGSKGALYYPPEEVSRDPSIWNGVPIVVHHPSANGQHVSARDPEVIDRQGVGVVLRSKFNGRKLVAEGWFDIDALKRIDPTILSNLEAGRPVELSTGLFTDNQPAPDGSHFNGRPYSYIARNYRADHLAVFSDLKGACSLQDGCGVLVNGKAKGKKAKPCDACKAKGGKCDCEAKERMDSPKEEATENVWSAQARAKAIAARRSTLVENAWSPEARAAAALVRKGKGKGLAQARLGVALKKAGNAYSRLDKLDTTARTKLGIPASSSHQVVAGKILHLGGSTPTGKYGTRSLKGFKKVAIYKERLRRADKAVYSTPLLAKAKGAPGYDSKSRMRVMDDAARRESSTAVGTFPSVRRVDLFKTGLSKQTQPEERKKAADFLKKIRRSRVNNARITGNMQYSTLVENVWSAEARAAAARARKGFGGKHGTRLIKTAKAEAALDRLTAKTGKVRSNLVSFKRAALAVERTRQSKKIGGVAFDPRFAKTMQRLALPRADSANRKSAADFLKKIRRSRVS